MATKTDRIVAALIHAGYVRTYESRSSDPCYKKLVQMYSRETRQPTREAWKFVWVLTGTCRYTFDTPRRADAIDGKQFAERLISEHAAAKIKD